MCFISIFLQIILGITPEITSIKKPFHSISLSLLGAILRYFKAHLGVYSFISRELLQSYEVLYRCFLYYPDLQCAKKNFTARIPVLRALCSFLGSILGIFLNILRNLQDYLDILHICFYINFVVSKLKVC